MAGIIDFEENTLQQILNYKSFYEAINVGFVDRKCTPVTRLLFLPVIDIKNGLFVVNEADNKTIEITSQNATAWCKGRENIPGNLKKAVGKKATLERLILHFNSKIFADELFESAEDEMFDNVLALIKNCELSQTAKKEFLKDYYRGDRFEFLARVFQRSVQGNNVVSDKQKIIQASQIESESVNEFNKIIFKKKPDPDIPLLIQSKELTYVNQLFAAYNTTGENVNISSLKDLEQHKLFLEHFEHQRQTFYLAEVVYRETRDTFLPGDYDPFESLKNEIEMGIFEAKNNSYDDAVKKVNAVVSTAATLSISDIINDATYHWIGVGEKKGVCHMLVNDNRLRWVD